MRFYRILFGAVLWTITACSQDPDCDLSAYKPQSGFQAQLRGGVLEVTWQGERQEQLRVGFDVQGGQPTIRELAVRRKNGNWIVLGRNLLPEFEVTSTSSN